MTGLCPAVSTLKSTLASQIPYLFSTFKEWNGKQSPRLQGITADGRHATGLALDIILFSAPEMTNDAASKANWKNEKALAENLVYTFVELKDLMGWTEIILQNRLLWTPTRSSEYTFDKKHYTHIHMDWMTNDLKGKGKTVKEIVTKSPQGNNNNFDSALINRLQQINQQFQNNQLSSIDLATIKMR